MPPGRSQLSPAAQRALPYWGVIMLAAQEGLTTADMWSAIHDEAERLGLASPGVGVVGVSELRGRAGEIVSKGQLFDALGDSRRVTSRVVSTPPWARPLRQQRAMPKFAVNFQHTFTKGGNLVTEWRTSMFTGKPGQYTAGQLRALVELDAQNMARKYQTEHVGLDTLQLMAV